VWIAQIFAFGGPSRVVAPVSVFFGAASIRRVPGFRLFLLCELEAALFYFTSVLEVRRHLGLFFLSLERPLFFRGVFRMFRLKDFLPLRTWLLVPLNVSVFFPFPNDEGDMSYERFVKSQITMGLSAK